MLIANSIIFIMSTCSICNNKVTRNHPLYLNTNVCTECITKIKKVQVVITTSENNFTDACNSSANVSDGSIHRICDEENIVFVDSSGKLVRQGKLI